MSSSSVPPSGENPIAPFEKLASYYNTEVPSFEEKVRDAQRQLDLMKAAQHVVNTFSTELGYAWAKNKPDPKIGGMIFGSGSALVGLAYPLSSTSTLPISANILASGTNSNVASLVVGLQTVWPGSFPETKSALTAYSIPLQSIAETLKQALEKRGLDFLDRATALIHDLEASTHLDRYGNAGKNIRELLRLLYYHYAPDKIVTKWSELEVDAEKKRPTRLCRLRFGPFGMYPSGDYPSDFSSNVETIARRLIKQNDDLNKLTHAEGSSGAMMARPVLNNVMSDMLTWLDLVERGSELRALHVLDLFQEKLDSLMDDVIPHLEEGYSHVYDIDPMAEDCRITSENAEGVEVAGTGTISFTAQLGSDGDVRRGDGLVGPSNRSFEFRCQMKWASMDEVELPDDCLALVEEDYDPSSD